MIAKIIKKVFSSSKLKREDNAKEYVSTNEISGEIQLELLRLEGCIPKSKVLEVGCGCLHTGLLLIKYLEQGNYVGIDPNEWLRNEELKKHSVKNIVNEKNAKFLSVDNFDASALGFKFDFVLSHSVLSHFAHWQLAQFLENIKKVLHPDGLILASIRLSEGNKYGSSGSPDKRDSMDENWVYPGVSFFSLMTLNSIADTEGFTVTHIPEYTAIYIKKRPSELHDWLVFKLK